MKFVLFGLPCAGKTYQINKINNLFPINRLVPRDGIEPSTQGFSVPCSTD